MNEAELVEGVEYAGEYTKDGSLVRGRIRRDAGRLVFEHDGIPRARVTLWQDGNCYGFHAWLDTLRRVDAPVAIAEKDRLHETGCCLCGAETTWRLAHDSLHGKPLPSHNRQNPGCFLCRQCAGPHEQAVRDADQEITRRKAIAAGQPVFDVDDPRIHSEPAPTPAPVTQPKPDPYAAHRAKTDEAAIAAATAERDRVRGNRQREAFRMLDREATRKYPYCESSVCFATAQWESD